MNKDLQKVREFIKTGKKPSVSEYRQLVSICHPDLNSDPEAKQLFILIEKLYNGEKLFIFKIGKYEAISHIIDGTTYKIYDCGDSVIKISRYSKYNHLAKKEFEIRQELFKITKNKPLYLEPIESILVNKRQCNFYTKRQLLSLNHWKVLDNRHIIWILKTIALSLQDFKELNIVHNKIDSSHILLEYEKHATILTGFSSIKKNQEENYDIRDLGKTILPFCNLPKIKRYVEYLSCAKLHQQPTPSQLYYEVDELAARVFGPKKFVKLLP